MSEWWSYRPDDFLLFAPRTYWRLFELQIAALWPLPVIALLIGLSILALIRRPRRWSGRAIAVALAAAWAWIWVWVWVWVGWSFVGGRYAAINWAMAYAEPAFYAQAVLLVWFGALRNRFSLAAVRAGPALTGLALYLYALALHPLLAVISGRPLAGAEIVGVAPDTTAVATLGLLAMLPRSGPAAPLLAIPVAWCLISWATLATIGTWEAWVPLAAVVAAIGARLWAAIRPPPSRAPRDG